MKWNAYIYNPKTQTTSKHTFELPNSSKGDNRWATMEAAKKFRANEDRILCIPTPKGES